MRDAARRAAGGVKENVISSPIYMKTGPQKVSIALFIMQGGAGGGGGGLVIDSVGGLWLAAHLMRKPQPPGKHKSEPAELINRD